MSHSMGFGNLAKVRRKIEHERLRKAMPWATDREVRATCEHLLYHLDLSGHFAANQWEAPVNTLRGPSPAIWNQGAGTAFSRGGILEDPSKGVLFHEDFLSFGGTVSSKVGTYSGDHGGWKSYEETGGTIAQSNTLGISTASAQASGVVVLSTDTTAQDTVALAAGYDAGGNWQLVGNTNPTLCFEARVYMNMATIVGCDTFVGLCEKGAAAAAFLFSTSDAINQKSYIGFYTLTAAVTSIKPAYGKVSTAGVAVTNGAGAGTYVAQTWTKLGFVYHPMFTNGRLLQYYQDGSLRGWVVDCSVSAFPTSRALTPCIVLQNDNASANISSIASDWIDVGQTYQAS